MMNKNNDFGLYNNNFNNKFNNNNMNIQIIIINYLIMK